MEAFVIGAILGVGVAWSFSRAGMLTDRNVATVMLLAIAVFWPVFAVDRAELDWVWTQSAAFVVFAAAAFWGRVKGLVFLAVFIVAHGVFDLVIAPASPAGPGWWPAFCAGFDVVLGVGLLMSVLGKRDAI